MIYDSKETQFKELSVSVKGVMALDQDNSLWGWGLNVSHRFGLTTIEEGGLQKPFKLYNLNMLGLTPIKFSLGKVHSLILFKDTKGKEMVYSVGTESSDIIKHLGVENEQQVNESEDKFRHLPLFDDRKVINILAHDNTSSIVLLDGDIQENLGLYHHSVPGLN